MRVSRSFISVKQRLSDDVLCTIHPLCAVYYKELYLLLKYSLAMIAVEAVHLNREID